MFILEWCMSGSMDDRLFSKASIFAIVREKNKNNCFQLTVYILGYDSRMLLAPLGILFLDQNVRLKVFFLSIKVF